MYWFFLSFHYVHLYNFYILYKIFKEYSFKWWLFFPHEIPSSILIAITFRTIFLISLAKKKSCQSWFYLEWQLGKNRLRLINFFSRPKVQNFSTVETEIICTEKSHANNVETIKVINWLFLIRPFYESLIILHCKKKVDWIISTLEIQFVSLYQSCSLRKTLSTKLQSSTTQRMGRPNRYRIHFLPILNSESIFWIYIRKIITLHYKFCC